MSEDQLYLVLDYILNQAPESEIEVIIAALKKRLAAMQSTIGPNPAKMGKAMADEINSQVKESLESVHRTARDFIAEMIRKEVPDIPEEHLETLLKTWAPGPGEKPRTRIPPPLPRDVLLTMIRQFLSFSLGTMSPSEQKRLREEIPDWHEEYWKRFSPSVRRLLSLVLNEKIDEEVFWDRLESELESEE